MTKPTLEPVKCGKCGAVFNEPIGNRVPCPSCGSKQRIFTQELTTYTKTNTHISALQMCKDKAVGFFESVRKGLSSRATLENNGSVSNYLEGSSPQGEADTITTCQTLRERLNLDGANWGSVMPGNEPADCVFIDADNSKKILEVQVVRAVTSQELWRTLNRKGSIQRILSTVEAVTEIKAAIELKVRKIPKSMRAELILALDTTRLPGFALDGIVYNFRSENMKWVVCQGFKAVWLVGPVPRLVWRLDSLE